MVVNARPHIATVGLIAAMLIGCAGSAPAQSADTIDLVLNPGRPMRVALDTRTVVTRVGQPVTGTLVDALCVYDRVVVPAGTRVLGHIAKLDDPPRFDRVRAIVAGDFSPSHIVTLQFDAFLLADGRQRSFATVVKGSTTRVAVKMAEGADANARDEGNGDESEGAVAQAKSAAKQRASEEVSRAKDEARQVRDRVKNARQEAAQKARDTVAAIKSPGKVGRLRDATVSRLPYHPQLLPQGTVYDVELTTAVDFGVAPAGEAAPAGAAAAPSSILNARLVTALDSSKTVRGAEVEAVLTEPVFSADHQLLLPEGTRLKGEVTRARAAGHMHRAGELRFLFESIQPPARESAAMLGSLYSVQVGDANDVTVDDEGGARAQSSKTRFIAPMLGLLAMRASLRSHERELDGDADDSLGPRPGGNPVTFGIGGFLGWSIAGAAISQLSRPVAIGISAVGVSRSFYSAVFGKGREVQFPADTLIQIELASKPAPVER